MIINDYENFSSFANNSNANLSLNAIKAKNRLQSIFVNSIIENEDLVIIKVEDYYNVCLVSDEFQPIEIYTTVIPFDEKQVYPAQVIKNEIRYLTYNEVMKLPF